MFESVKVIKIRKDATTYNFHIMKGGHIVSGVTNILGTITDIVSTDMQ